MSPLQLGPPAILALVEVVEAASRMRGKHATRTQWMHDKRALDAALARFTTNAQAKA